MENSIPSKVHHITFIGVGRIRIDYEDGKVELRFLTQVENEILEAAQRYYVKLIGAASGPAS